MAFAVYGRQAAISEIMRDARRERGFNPKERAYPEEMKGEPTKIGFKGSLPDGTEVVVHISLKEDALGWAPGNYRYEVKPTLRTGDQGSARP